MNFAILLILIGNQQIEAMCFSHIVVYQKEIYDIILYKFNKKYNIVNTNIMTKEFFEEVMRIPSCSSHEDMMQEYILDWASKHGC